MKQISNDEIINLFRNEFIIKMNQYRRLGIEPSEKNAMTSILKNHKLSRATEWMGIFKYNIASLLNLIYIFFSSKKELEKNIFLFTDHRQTKKNYNEAQLVKIGLYNFRNFKYLHILNVLKNIDIVEICIKSLLNYRGLQCNIKRYAKNINQNEKIFLNIVNFSYFKYLDILLTIKALEKNNKSNIYFSGHFDAYVALLSLLNRRGGIKYLCGYQHGLYELPRIELEYEKFYTDEYVLMFEESKIYFMKYLNANNKCLINVREQRSLLNLKEFNKHGKRLIVFAMQTDNYDLDKEILTTLIKKYDVKDNILVCYLHPATRANLVTEFISAFPNVIFETSQRYTKVDLLFTRYSTIGLEYAKINSKVYYILYGDNICITKSETANLTFINTVEYVK